jgi:hypothetical protein
MLNAASARHGTASASAPRPRPMRWAGATSARSCPAACQRGLGPAPTRELVHRAEDLPGLGGRAGWKVGARHPRVVEAEQQRASALVTHARQRTQVLQQVLQRDVRRRDGQHAPGAPPAVLQPVAGEAHVRRQVHQVRRGGAQRGRQRAGAPARRAAAGRRARRSPPRPARAGARRRRTSAVAARSARVAAAHRSRRRARSRRPAPGWRPAMPDATRLASTMIELHAHHHRSPLRAWRRCRTDGGNSRPCCERPQGERAAIRTRSHVLLPLRQRQLHREGGPDGRGGRDADAAAVGGGDLARDVQAQPHPGRPGPAQAV